MKKETRTVCRVNRWLAMGLHIIRWTDEACQAACWLTPHEFWSGLASCSALLVLGVCPALSQAVQVAASGGLRSQMSKWDFDLQTPLAVPSSGYVLQGLTLVVHGPRRATGATTSDYLLQGKVTSQDFGFK